MSRSCKKPICRISSKVNKQKRRAVRHIVKQELKKENPDEFIITADTRELGLEECGTVYGYDISDIVNSDSDWDIEQKNKLSRK